MILVNNISKSYKSLFGKTSNEFNILNDISFKINKGDIIGIVGHNGSGKTTLLKILFNLINEDSGNILLSEGKDDYKEFIKKKASLINNNERSFFWRLSVASNIDFFNSLLNNPSSKKNIQEKIDYLDINHLMEKKFGTLSSGEKTKVLLLRGLIKNPDLIFFDEIMNSLDVQSKNIVMHYIKKINYDGVTIVWVTHSLDEIDALCNRFIIMKNGCIYSKKNTKEILSAPSEFIYRVLSE